MNPKGYAVKTEIFEGPLALLLDLVEKRKLFVNDVSLSEVADDFINYLHTHEEFPLNESAEFIVVASTLMLIKSKSLLPTLELTEDEKENIEDLSERLRLYAETKELSIKIKSLFGKNIIFEKTSSKSQIIVFSPDKHCNLPELSMAFENVVESLPKKENLPKALVRKIISLEETIEKLAERISQSARMNFKDFYKTNIDSSKKLTHEDKVTIIVGFLAMLELVRRGVIRATQETKSEIEIETENISVPQYV
ncbi:MAG: segregation/condensation protein A [bacterium]|nr:segregation/condensation protein A [bacterium]